MDLYEGHRLVTTGPYALTRHPMYLGIVIFHYGAALGLDSFLLMIVSVVYVLPFTIARIGAEERVLREGLPGYAAYAARVPSLLPIARP